jgi:subtilisin family serine protease
MVMTEREYIVSLHRGVDADQFNKEMIESTGAGAIPNRTVDIADARPGSYRNTHYALTDAEAETLRNDPRVAGVELRPEEIEDIFIGRNAIQTDSFEKTTSDSAAVVNWGLRRLNEETNPYTGSTAEGGYNYTLTGEGVDVVVLDSGVQFGHPEVYQGGGQIAEDERLQRISWFNEAGVVGTQPGGLYNDYDGHGTHVISVVAGHTFGWAKKARIYSMKVAGLEGPADPQNGIAVNQCFDLVKLWHRNKPIDPATGYKRPTVVNLSWGYYGYFTNIAGGSYRGTPWTDTVRQTDKGMIGVYDGNDYKYPVRLVSVDTDIQEMIDEGIHVVIAAGNSRQKIDIPEGLDYDNYWYTASSPSTFRYYHRGGSPYDDEAIIVGNLDSVTHVGGLEQKASTSETGPGVTIYAPGTDIMGASSQNSVYTTAPYQFGNTFYKQMNISGSSMAAPQVAGLLALYLQINPGATPAQAKNWLILNQQTSQIYETGLDDDYTDDRSLLGGNNTIAFNPYNLSDTVRIRFA